MDDTNKFENRFGTIRDEEIMLAFKLMLESLLERRCRTVNFSLHIGEVATVAIARTRKIDTSAPMKLGMAAKDDCEV